ncbi:MAG: hypothetical protein R2853_01755 [Thermomicrobiales bacterium]
MRLDDRRSHNDLARGDLNGAQAEAGHATIRDDQFCDLALHSGHARRRKRLGLLRRQRRRGVQE